MYALLGKISTKSKNYEICFFFKLVNINVVSSYPRHSINICEYGVVVTEQVCVYLVPVIFKKCNPFCHFPRPGYV